MSYHGPVIAITLDDARAILPTLLHAPAAANVVVKIQAALDSDPKWREPTT